MTKAEQKSNLLVLCVDTCRNNRATHHNTPTLPLENNQIHRRRKREARVTTDASKTIFNGRTTRIIANASLVFLLGSFGGIGGHVFTNTFNICYVGLAWMGLVDE